MNKSRSFFISAETDESLLKLLPEHWEQYFRRTDDSQKEIVLTLKIDEALGEKRYPNGWSLDLQKAVKRAVYTHGGKAWFSLEYDWLANEVTVCARAALSCFVRSGMMYGMLTALHRSCIGMHGVTLVCKNQVIILSAPSGTGKTTLAGLLEKYCDARVINGDFALLSVSEDGVYFEPTPFCGTSRICMDERVKVDRIVFLAQSSMNVWKNLSGREAVISVLNNAFVPSFDSQLQQYVQSGILELMPFVETSNYAFAPTEAAARLFVDMIAI